MTTRIHVGNLLCSTAFISSLFLFSNHASAQDNAVQLDTISIQSSLDEVSDATTKTDDKIINTLAGTSLVTKEELTKFQFDSAGGFLAAVPGVNIEEASDDPGVAINIRGLQDFGRVNVMIDGARQNFQRSGHNADGQFYFEPELVKRVDVVRGPVSTIYGSGAIGGVVNFETIDPADMLRHGETWAASIKGQYSTNDEGKLVSAIGAVKATDTVSMLANFVWRDHDNYEDGNGIEIENTDKELVSGLIKGVFDFGVGNQLKLGYIHKKDEYTTGLVSDANQQDTEAEDQTFSAKWTYNPTGNDLIDLNVSGYFTSTRLEQTRLDALFSSRGALQVSAGNKRFFDIDTIGFDVFNSSRFSTGEFNHTLTYGGDYFKDDVKTEDTGLGGSGDEFTPSGERKTYGFYIQDKLEYGNWLEVIAALRYDSYELSGNGINVEEDQLSPKLTVGVTPVKGVQFYATYAEGFRAPAISETLQSGVHPVPPAFDIIPNVNLRPETAENIEGGVNLSFDKIFSEKDVFRAKASIFRNDVDDFIENRVVGFDPTPAFPNGPPFCFLNGTGCGESQYVNIANARLEGFELEATYDNRLMFVNLAYTHVRGDDLTNGQPLKSIYPDKVVATVGFRFLEDKLTVGGRWTYADAQNRVPDAVDPTDPSIDETPTPSYSLVDLFATYEVNENFSTALTLNNIFDEDYRIHRHEENEAGFSAKLSATVRFGG
ncbi:MAG: ligand-gated channel [Methyloligella sp.]|nr:MAG: ligand-gated channel [Methyloligella sp.]